MRALLLCLPLLLAACSGMVLEDRKSASAASVWPLRNLEPPPTLQPGIRSTDDPGFRNYISEVNAYAYYVFVYARNLNDYAKMRNWRIPQPAPICERFEINGLNPIPGKVDLAEAARSPQDISRDLASQLKRLLGNYRQDRATFSRALEAHNATCIN